jgi:hypothetical protein
MRPTATPAKHRRPATQRAASWESCARQHDRASRRQKDHGRRITTSVAVV